MQFAVVFGQTEASRVHLPDRSRRHRRGQGRHPRAARCPAWRRGSSTPTPATVVGRGEVGELRGPRARTSWPATTSCPRRPRRPSRPGGWLRTGDLVTMDERGYLRMTGRLKEMIVSGGENIFPVEIENALARASRRGPGRGGGRARRPVGRGGRGRGRPRRRARAGRRPTSRRSCAIGWRRSRCPAVGSSSTTSPARRRARSRSTWSGTSWRHVA